MGLSYYLTFEMIPDRAVDWVQANIESKLVFLLILNIFLLIVGCLMDVFPAIVVVVPLILPMGLAFGIDPIHLGIIFLANLELGYLTPPVGMNLFLSSYRLNKPVLEVARSVIPILLVLLIGVLMITYFPPLTTFLPGLLD
jgi:TRAP-type C4-dicarboxylate transport system permease large subunit